MLSSIGEVVTFSGNKSQFSDLLSILSSAQTGHITEKHSGHGADTLCQLSVGCGHFDVFQRRSSPFSKTALIQVKNESGKKVMVLSTDHNGVLAVDDQFYPSNSDEYNTARSLFSRILGN